MQVLIIEDQPGLFEMVKQGLEENGLEVNGVKDGLKGYEMLISGKYDVAVVDLLLPGMHGLDICKKARNKGILTPIIIVSALDSVDDRVAGLEVGADDYLPKPFHFTELLARIRALERRKNAEYNSAIHTVEDLVINVDNYTVKRGGIDIDLTKKEFRLLEYFMKNENKVLSKSEIAEKVWDIDFNTGTNIVEVYVNYLRNKLDKDFDKKLIHTKFGMGYIFNPVENAD